MNGAASEFDLVSHHHGLTNGGGNGDWFDDGGGSGDPNDGPPNDGDGDLFQSPPHDPDTNLDDGIEFGEIRGMPTFVVAGRDNRAVAFGIYVDAVTVGGYQVQTRVKGDLQTVVAMPPYSARSGGELESSRFAIRVGPGVELVSETLNPISGQRDAIECTCKEFRFALIAAGAESEGQYDDSCCFHTQFYASKYCPLVARIAAQPSGTALTGLSELEQRIIAGFQYADAAQSVIEYIAAPSSVQFFTVFPSNASRDVLTLSKRPPGGIVTVTSGTRASDTTQPEHKLRCRSKLCNRRCAASLPAAIAAGDAGDQPGEEPRFRTEPGEKLCTHLQEVYQSILSRSVALRDLSSLHPTLAESAAQALQSETDTGMYKEHEHSYYWRHRPTGSTDDGNSRPVTFADIKAYSESGHRILPEPVSHLSRLLNVYKARATDISEVCASHGEDHQLPDERDCSIYLEDSCSTAVPHIKLTTSGLLQGPDLFPQSGRCISVGPSGAQCQGVLGELVIDKDSGAPTGLATLYSLVGAFQCSLYKRWCPECGVWMRFTGHGSGMVRETAQTVFSLDLFFEYTERLRTALGSGTFSHFSDSVTRLYTGIQGHPPPSESTDVDGDVNIFTREVPAMVHSFGQTDTFVNWWFTVVSASRIDYPTILPCVKHGIGNCCDVVCDAVAAGPQASLLREECGFHAPGQPANGAYVHTQFGTRRYMRTWIPNLFPTPATPYSGVAGKEVLRLDATRREKFRAALRALGKHACACDTLVMPRVQGQRQAALCGCGCAVEDLLANIACIRTELQATAQLLQLATPATAAPEANETATTEFVCPPELVLALSSLLQSVDGTVPPSVPPSVRADSDRGRRQSQGLLLACVGAACSVTSWLHPEDIQELSQRIESVESDPTNDVAVTALDVTLMRVVKFYEAGLVVREDWLAAKCISDSVLKMLKLLLSRAKAVHALCQAKEQELNTVKAQARSASGFDICSDDHAVPRNPSRTASFYYANDNGEQVAGRRGTHFAADSTVGSAPDRHEQYDDPPPNRCTKTSWLNGAAKGLTMFFSVFCAATGTVLLTFLCVPLVVSLHVYMPHPTCSMPSYYTSHASTVTVLLANVLALILCHAYLYVCMNSHGLHAACCARDNRSSTSMSEQDGFWADTLCQTRGKYLLWLDLLR